MVGMASGSGNCTPLLAKQPALVGPGRRYLVATAAVCAVAAVLCASAIMLTSHAQVPSALVERQFDLGEDWFSAVEAPHKTYEWPWLKDGKFYHQSKVMAYGPEENWDYMTGWRAYRRSPYDEFGDRGYEVDQRPADDCYANGGDDCFREVFDPDTGFLPA